MHPIGAHTYTRAQTHTYTHAASWKAAYKTLEKHQDDLKRWKTSRFLPENGKASREIPKVFSGLSIFVFLFLSPLSISRFQNVSWICPTPVQLRLFFFLV